MVDAEMDGMDKVVQPYMNYDHENKTVQRRFKNRPELGSGYAASPFTLYKVISDKKRLITAASCNDTEKVKQLLERGVNPNLPDENGRTALHIACCRGFSDIVNLLLSHNADCNAVDKLGNTPLHLAVCTTSKVTVDLLLKAGCCVTRKGNNGCTPLQLAQSKLMLLQRNKHPHYEVLKKEVSEVVEMMKKLVRDESEAELVNAFSSRLSLTQSSDEVVNDVKNLLDKLSNLIVDNSLARKPTPGNHELQSSCTNYFKCQN